MNLSVLKRRIQSKLVMSTKSNSCWYLTRVINLDESFAFFLNNQNHTISVGRRESTNDFVCIGPHVSRNHLQLIRTDPCSRGRIKWSLLDLGGIVGTFVNLIKVKPFIPFPLSCGDLIGVGSPESSSRRQAGKETFVFKIHSPMEKEEIDPELEEMVFGASN